MSDLPARIMPGDRFPVKYGNGKTIEVVALAGKAQRELGKLIDQLRKTEESQEIEQACVVAEQALAYCMDEEKAKKLWETELDLELAMEIAGATFAKQSLTVDERKKLESPH